MAITGPSSYIPTINEFLPHWGEANQLRAAAGTDAELTVRISGQMDKVTRVNLSAWLVELIAYASQIEEQILERDLSRARNREFREALHERLNQFNRSARANLAGTFYPKVLPKVPPITVGESRILLALHEANILWKAINTSAQAGDLPELERPLTLLGGYDQAMFQAGIAQLRVSYERIVQDELELKIIRMRRDAVQELVYATLRGYRATIQAQYPSDDPMVHCLPRLSPLPGSTPEPVAAAIAWDAAAGQAVLTWEASGNPNLAYYQIRYSPGESYDSDAETVQGRIAPDAPREFVTRKGLNYPGDVAAFKVYVVLNTGNERGSAAVVVKRPASTNPVDPAKARLNGSVPAGTLLSA